MLQVTSSFDSIQGSRCDRLPRSAICRNETFRRFYLSGHRWSDCSTPTNAEEGKRSICRFQTVQHSGFRSFSDLLASFIPSIVCEKIQVWFSLGFCIVFVAIVLNLIDYASDSPRTGSKWSHLAMSLNYISSMLIDQGRVAFRNPNHIVVQSAQKQCVPCFVSTKRRTLLFQETRLAYHSRGVVPRRRHLTSFFQRKNQDSPNVAQLRACLKHMGRVGCGRFQGNIDLEILLLAWNDQGKFSAMNFST